MMQAPYYQRGFATINFEAIKPENSVSKVYNQLVEDGQIRSDPNQIAVVNMLEKWQKNFISKEARLSEFQEEYTKVAEFGHNAKKL